ncbi:MAG: 4Fe-4S dicluster domain-containing protein [Desulfamplus sp.]|nr:4Fe-4S dicluster domain-containing protein [Desulfamplus sp.]
MKIIKIDKKLWSDGVEKSRAAYRLIGPVKDKEFHQFRELAKGEQPDMNYKNSRLSPKSIAFPQSETMFLYDLDEKAEAHHIMQDAPKDYSPRAVIGIRPYDAKAFKILDLNFNNSDYQDPYWINSYNCTTFIGLANSSPDKFDFSTSCGTGPFDDSAVDVLLVDYNDSYLAKIMTDKGSAWLNAAGFTTKNGEIDGTVKGVGEAEEDIYEIIEKLKADAEAKITSKVAFDKIKEKSILDIFNAPFWEDIAFACLNCGTCTYSCPTCWCFDIQDETKGKKGIRQKNWDSCMTSLFTVHATGHNPRHNDWERTRQRFMHKLKYFQDKYNQGIMCVGCGRCVEQCPANIDIRNICNQMNNGEWE